MNKLLSIAVILMFVTTVSYTQKKSYSGDVKPIFQSYGCLECHGGSGNLFLGTYAEVFSTGEHAPVIVANDTNSILIKKLKGTAGFGDRMPQGGAPVSASDLNTIIQWVKEGAPENPTEVIAMHDRTVFQSFELQQNYPNPFNPTTNIQFTIPVSAQTKLSLFDAVGKEMMVLVDRFVDAGSYSYQLNVSQLPSGVYFYRLQSGVSSSSRKLSLMK